MKKRDLMFAGIFIFFCFGVILGRLSTQLDQSAAEKELANCERVRSLSKSKAKQQMAGLEKQLAECSEKLATAEAPPQLEAVTDAAQVPAGGEAATAEEAPSGEPAGGPDTAS